MKYTKEDRLRKIQAMLRHEQSAREIGNIEEAEVFSAKLHKMLESYNLEMSEVEGFKEQREKDITSTDKLNDSIYVDQKRQYGNWEQRLMTYLCDFNYCKLILSGRKGKNGQRVLIVGTKENIEVVKYLHAVLSNTLLPMGEDYYDKCRHIERMKVARYATNKMMAAKKVAEEIGIHSSHLVDNVVKLKNEYAEQEMLDEGLRLYSVQEFGTIPDPYSQLAYKPKFVESYLLGACEGIRRKLQEELDAMKPKKAEKANALVKVNNAAVQKYMDDNFNLGKARASSRKVKYNAFAKGEKDGKKVSVNKGVSAGTTGQKSIGS